MKKYFIIVSLLLGFTLSCSDDFTSVNPVGGLDEISLANEEGIELLLTGAYSVLDGIRNNQGGSDWSASGDNWWFDVLSDEAHKGSTDGDQADLYLLETYDWSTGNPYIIGKWLALYAGVNRANAVLSLIDKIEGQDFPEKQAEARFLRGHYNFELQKIYGNPSFVSSQNYTDGDFNQPNSGPIWDKIEEDFTFAMNNLPDSQSDAGRPNKWTAMAFLGKAHLHQNEFGPAYSLFRDVINTGPYQLLPEFVDNFRISGENSTESVFSIQFTADGGQSWNGNRGGTLNFPGGGPFGSCCGFYQPTQDLVNAFQTDGSGLPLLDTWNQSDVTNDYGLDSYKVDGNGDVILDADNNPVPTDYTPHTGPLDPRLDYTAGRRGIDYNNWGEMPGKVWIRATFADISGPYLSKKNIYYQGEEGNQGTGGWGQQHSGVNYHIMRFADVLLMGAEAAAEENELGDALTWTNLVRNRAKNMTPEKTIDGTADAANYDVEPYSTFSDKDFAIKAIRFERRLELSMEGHRLFDIRRWGVGTQLMNEYFTNEARVIASFGDDPNAYEERHNLLPIPLSAIDQSQGVITQNPGF